MSAALTRVLKGIVLCGRHTTELAARAQHRLGVFGASLGGPSDAPLILASRFMQKRVDFDSIFLDPFSRIPVLSGLLDVTSLQS